MTADVLTFPSRGSPRDDRQGRIERAAPPREVVEVVGLNLSPGKDEDALKRMCTRTAPPILPIEPNLPHRVDRGSGGIERQTLPLPPRLQGTIPLLRRHVISCKPLAYALTSECKHVTGSIVSANVLLFRPMSDDPNRIRELRTAAGMSQQELGNRAGCSKMTISDLERGNMELTLTYMKRIAPALGVAVADLLPRAFNDLALSADERKYLERYRNADEQQRETLTRVTEAVAPLKDRAA